VAQLLTDHPWPARMTALVLAPHPDDFDAIGVTLRHLNLKQAGHALHLAVLTQGANGVDDGLDGARTDEEKAALREAEQRASCGFLGLPNACRFMRLLQRVRRPSRRTPPASASWCWACSRIWFSCRTATTATRRIAALSTASARWPPPSG
jgi:LmbE family N-acetylglucosaminyl deacetylase